MFFLRNRKSFPCWCEWNIVFNYVIFFINFFFEKILLQIYSIKKRTFFYGHKIWIFSLLIMFFFSVCSSFSTFSTTTSSDVRVCCRAPFRMYRVFFTRYFQSDKIPSLKKTCVIANGFSYNLKNFLSIESVKALRVNFMATETSKSLAKIKVHARSRDWSRKSRGRKTNTKHTHMVDFNCYSDPLTKANRIFVYFNIRKKILQWQ